MGRAEDLQLNGFKVLVTRPLEQATSLLEAIRAHGGVGEAFPLFEIQSSPKIPAVFDSPTQLAQFDLIIFVSPNAVKYTWMRLDSLPPGVKVAAIGQVTAAAIKANGQDLDFVPVDSFDSEALLALDGLQELQGQKVLIVRGQSGREHLAEGLRERGAEVEYAEVYHRLKTKQALTNEQADVGAIVVSSTEAIKHLAACAQRDQQSWVFGKTIVVIHPRIAMHARELGFTLSPVVVEPGHDEGLDYAIIKALKSIEK